MKTKPVVPTSNGYRKLDQIMREGDVTLSDIELSDLRLSLMNHALVGGENDELIKIFIRLTGELIERRREEEVFAKLVGAAENVIAMRDSRKAWKEALDQGAEPKEPAP